MGNEKREEQIRKKAKELGQMFFPDSSNVWARENFEAKCVEAACIEMARWLDSYPQWIPVEERLPPFDCIEDGSYRCSQPVLIYDPIRAWIYVGRYESDDLYGNTYWVYGNGKRPTREVCGGYEIDNVTHWMPLPQPPRKEDDNE